MHGDMEEEKEDTWKEGEMQNWKHVFTTSAGNK